MDFGHNNLLYSHVDVNDMIEFVRQAGFSGIMSIDLSKTHLDAHLSMENFIELTKQAGLSGIKCLSLAENDEYSFKHPDEWHELIIQAARSGIRVLDIGKNEGPAYDVDLNEERVAEDDDEWSKDNLKKLSEIPKIHVNCWPNDGACFRTY